MQTIISNTLGSAVYVMYYVFAQVSSQETVRGGDPMAADALSVPAVDRAFCQTLTHPLLCKLHTLYSCSNIQAFRKPSQQTQTKPNWFTSLLVYKIRSHCFTTVVVL